MISIALESASKTGSIERVGVNLAITGFFTLITTLSLYATISDSEILSFGEEISFGASFVRGLKNEISAPLSFSNIRDNPTNTLVSDRPMIRTAKNNDNIPILYLKAI